MPTHLTLLLGDAGSGKTEFLLARYRAALAEAREQGRSGTTLWIAPTHRTQHVVIERLLDADSPIQLAPRVLTFDVFAERILAAAGKPATRMSPVMKRLLFRRIVAELNQRGQLTSFSTVAQTSGFLDVVSAFITELKREEIWPEEFLEVCSRQLRGRGKRDRELGLIYERYQHHLTEQNWYDNEGRFWLARNELQQGQKGPFGNTEFLVVDGFADFTQTQHEILANLMQWIPQTVISLPHETPLTRTDLFEKPQSTYERFLRNRPSGTVCEPKLLLADREDWPAGLRTVAESLFANPRQIVVSKDAEGLEVIAATGQLGEWQAIAQRIKRLLLAGVAPSEIVIAVRSVGESGALWRDYLDQAGIPVWCEAGSPLISSSLVKSLFSVMQLEAADWSFSRLVQVLGSNYFMPAWPELQTGPGTRAVNAVLRLLKLHSGRELMLRVLSRVAGGLEFEDADQLTNRQDSKVALAVLARSALAILKRLSSVTERLRQKKSLEDWSDVIVSLGRDLGWDRLGEPRGNTNSGSSGRDGADSRDRELIGERDRRAWDLLQRTVRTAAEADRRLISSSESKAMKPRKMDLPTFLLELRDLLSGEQIKPASDPGGCVRILDVEQARHLGIPHLFLVGLAESSFPMNRGDDCLFGELERQQFVRSGLPMQHRDQMQKDEMFLFYSVVTRARARLTLSYPAVNAKGQPVFASPYLIALRSLFSDSALPVLHEGHLDPVPNADQALTESDLRLLSIRNARSGSPGLFARLGRRREWLPTGLNILAAIDVTTHRFHERGFTGYEGRLTLDQNLQFLRKRFGSEHQFSATELEAYAECPYRHWVNSVLNINELLTPELGTDSQGRGNLIHDVLAQMLREGLDGSAEELEERFRVLIDERLAGRMHETELQRALTRVERRMLNRWGHAFSRQQVEYAQQLQDAWMGGVGMPAAEIPFGRLRGGPEGEIAGTPLVLGEGTDAVQVRGRIDRVDTGVVDGRRVFNVIDYKTGKAPRASLNDLPAGQSIQLALYALAVERLGLAGADASSYQLGYWSLKFTGFKRGYQQRPAKGFAPISPEIRGGLERELEDVIPRLVRGMREGKFYVENPDEHCTGSCALRTTCRVNQVRQVKQYLDKNGDILARSMQDERTDEPE